MHSNFKMILICNYGKKKIGGREKPWHKHTRAHTHSDCFSNAPDVGDEMENDNAKSNAIRPMESPTAIAFWNVE